MNRIEIRARPFPCRAVAIRLLSRLIKKEKNSVAIHEEESRSISSCISLSRLSRVGVGSSGVMKAPAKQYIYIIETAAEITVEQFLFLSFEDDERRVS